MPEGTRYFSAAELRDQRAERHRREQNADAANALGQSIEAMFEWVSHVADTNPDEVDDETLGKLELVHLAMERAVLPWKDEVVAHHIESRNAGNWYRAVKLFGVTMRGNA